MMLLFFLFANFAASQTTVTSKGYSDANCQTQIGNTGSGVVTGPNTCIVTSVGQVTFTGQATINGNTITLQGCTTAACSSCPGTPFTVTNGACTPGSTVGVSGSFTISWSTSGTCFHESTKISYKDSIYSLEEFSAHPECRIPHIVSSNGVSISTTCGSSQLRLTADHLVFTSKGLVTASSLSAGDILFSDLKETQQCRVTKITAETDQRYFGLNCLESTVLANGIKTSTFGRLHSIPATWMSWTGSVFGIEKASRWGDNFVEFLAKIKVL
jgi:hypothetical protein